MSKIINALSGILSDSKEEILNTPHGDRLTVNTRVAYVDKAYNCSDTFIEGTSVGILANLVVFIKGAESDEDPCYGHSMFIDLENKIDANTQLTSEANEFHGMLADFVVLDQDPFLVDPHHIKDIKVLATYLGGQKVFSCQ